MKNTIKNTVVLKNGHGIIFQIVDEDSIQVVIKHESKEQIVVTDILLNNPYLSDTYLLTPDDVMYDYYFMKLEETEHLQQFVTEYTVNATKDELLEEIDKAIKELQIKRATFEAMEIDY